MGTEDVVVKARIAWEAGREGKFPPIDCLDV